MIDAIRAPDANARQARAERILDAAAELLLRWGYKRVTIDDVAAEAGVGKGTIYLHWKTREALFYTVIAREYVTATEDFLASMRQDPQAILPHRLMRELFLIVLRRPLVHAVFVSDLEVLGKLVKGADQALEARQDRTLVEYLRLLVEHGLARGDLTPEELFHAVNATLGGFFLADVFSTLHHHLSPERRADLLATTLRRAFEIENPSPEVLEAIAPRVIQLFGEAAERYRAHVRRSYE